MSSASSEVPPLRVAGLFAGIGGIELGLQRHGHHTELLCEIDPAAQAVLRRQFLNQGPSLSESGIRFVADVKDVVFPESTEVVAAGFPCTDVSQAGRTAGIRGRNTGLIQHMFRLLDDQAEKLGRLKWLLLENVPFLLRLDRGEGMKYLVSALEARGFRWAYRVVDAQAFGLPQRRQRVILLASRTEDPRQVILADDATPVDRTHTPDKAVGFYWTEGLRGLGWAVDSVPTLKGGSTVGIPSPPAVWLPDGRIMTPGITAAERLQGFEGGWTLAMEQAGFRVGARWKAVGNAVPVPVAAWVGKRLRSPLPYERCRYDIRLDPSTEGWPSAAWGADGAVYRADVTTWPSNVPQADSLETFIGDDGKPLSPRATIGFLSRLMRSRLRQRNYASFVSALVSHYLAQGGDPEVLDEMGTLPQFLFAAPIET